MIRELNISGDIGVAYLFDDIWAWNHSEERLAKVTGSATPKRRIELAPDGRAVSFLEDDNLCIAHTDGSKFLQISEDASEDLFYGELDWVYQEEVYGRFNFKGT